MSAFKDAVAADIKGVFINPLEFADEHRINGKLMFAVIDRDIIKERPTLIANTEAEGVFKTEILVYVDAADLPQRPVEGELFRLDNKRYIVAEVAENMGVLEITITANEA